MRGLKCRHAGGWSHARGEARCRDCGTVRVTSYGALRTPDTPEVRTPPARQAHIADRLAAEWVARTARRRPWWGLVTPMGA
ncbi:DUF6255 family natural product biosynthesis protein [Streptomyces sp. ISL-11]|uniref:DUF6255 family natural product biosynthesis protein n=1 Tax=Streptomyces sp. ISL-11 TaxID=2819174 RepID=UPI0035B07A84